MSDSGYIDQKGTVSFSQLLEFSGAPPDFWALYLKAVCEVAVVRRATLCVATTPSENSEGAWRTLVSHPSGGRQEADPQLLEKAKEEGIARERNQLAFTVGGKSTGDGIVVLDVNPETNLQASLISLLATLPDAWQAERMVRVLQKQKEGLAGVLDLGLIIASQTKFESAAFATCNELAARLDCDRVSLGWQDDTVLKLVAISHADKFDKRSGVVRQTEAAMEETFDQDEILVCPPTESSSAIIREHQAYAHEAQIAHLCSVPLRAQKEVRGVLLLERNRVFDTEELQLLRVMSDQVGPGLFELRENTRAWPKRAWRGLKDRASGFLGPKHTGPKLAGVAGALVLLFLVVGRLPYSVEAPATVRSADVVFVTAPFDSFIDDVFFEVGDEVKAGSTLVTFDTRELLVQQAAELANLNRFKKEKERARAQSKLADMRVAEAQVNQAQAILDRTQYHLDQSTIKAPMDGVIVEGDLRKRLGAPVAQGDVLFQQASLEELYVQIEVSETDVHDILDRTSARMLFAAQTEDSFPLTIERIQPAGISTPAGVVFRVKAVNEEIAPEWWRPGMSGTAKIDTGWRNVGWILTHRTTDWLRKQLWW